MKLGKREEHKINIRSEDVKISIDKLDDLVRAEYNTTHNFLDYFAGKDSLNNVFTIKNQVIYGRRGTGKTHLLRALQESIINDSSKKQFPVYMDLREYKPLFNTDKVYYSIIILREIVIEMLKHAQENFTYLCALNEVDVSNSQAKQQYQAQLNRYLEKFMISFDGTSVQKMGTVSFDIKEIKTLSASMHISSSPAISGSGEARTETSNTKSEVRYITFSEIAETIKQFIIEFGINTIYLLIDEWSEIPLDIQPVLAELIKRSFITQKISLKIAAIPNRTRLSGIIDNDNYGLETGGDIFGYTLDNRYIYELDQDTTKMFFNELLYNHLALIDKKLYADFKDKNSFQAYGKFLNIFLANQSLREILIGSAGIPRDFLHIFISSYRNFMLNKGEYKRLALKDVRSGTMEWYETDKKEGVDKNTNAKLLLDMIISEILVAKKRYHFLIPKRYENHQVINDLIDLRVVHIRKEGISHKGNKGIVYNVYCLDYSCYTSSNIYHNKLNTNLLHEIETIDDFREIRRVALDDKFFDVFNAAIGNSFKCPNCSKMVDINHPAYVKQHICDKCFETIQD